MKQLFFSKVINFLSGGRTKCGWWSSGFQSTDSAVFVGGASRSGTTLLTRLLSAHPELYIGPETGIFTGNRNVEHLERVTKLPHNWLAAQIRRSCCQGDLVERLMRRLAADESKRRWGEKTPANIQHIKRIFEFFPHASFIHIIRDGRDVACSLRTHPEYKWSNGTHVRSGIINPWSKCVAEWERDVRAGIACRGDRRYCEIHYEALVASPERALTPVFNWLGLNWSPYVLTGYRRAGMPNHPAMTGAITQASVGRWRTDLDAEARQNFRGAANELLISLVYVEDDSWIGQSSNDVLGVTIV